MDESEKRRKKRRRRLLLLGLVALVPVAFCGLCGLGMLLPSDSPVTRTPAPRLTPTAVQVQEWQGVTVGMPFDDVLQILPEPDETVVLGEDEEGLILRKNYPGAFLVIARWEQNGVTCYRVREIWVRR